MKVLNAIVKRMKLFIRYFLQMYNVIFGIISFYTYIMKCLYYCHFHGVTNLYAAMPTLTKTAATALPIYNHFKDCKKCKLIF